VGYTKQEIIMDNRNKFDEFLAKMERYLLRIVIFALFLLALGRFFFSEVRANPVLPFSNPPTATHCSQRSDEHATADLDANSNVLTYSGGGHVVSRPRSSLPRQHGKAPPARSCSNQHCCRNGK
jgi:hypothetical protein